MGRWARVAAVAGLLVGLGAGRARAGETCFVLIFGSQTHPKQLRYTHTWATFVRAVGEGPDPSSYAIEANTISWLPRTLTIRTWSLVPEPGVNLDLERTLAAVYQRGESVTMWGPFIVHPESYERSLMVVQALESGRVQYRAIDTSRDLRISDCIHAVAAVDPQYGRRHYPLIRIGKPAARFMARQPMTRSDLDQRRYDNSWLIPRLGLDRYPIEVVPPQVIPARSCFLCLLPD